MIFDLNNVANYAVFFIGGALGGFIRQLVVGKGSVILWKRWEDEATGKRGVDLGILASLLIGGVVGILTDQSFLTAFAWGTTGSYLLEELMKRGQNNGDGDKQ